MVQTYAQRVHSRDKAKREKQKLHAWYVDLQQRLDADIDRILEEYAGDTDVRDDIAYLNRPETLEEYAFRTRGRYINKLKRERIKRQMEDAEYNTPPPWDEIVVLPRIETVFMGNLYEETALFDVSSCLSTNQRKRYEKIGG